VSSALSHTACLTPPAAYIKGTVNDPTTYPPPSAAHGSYHWAFERGLSVALLPLIAAGAVKHGASGVLDGVLALSLVVHSHIGFDCIIADYLHKRKFPVIGPATSWTLRAATVASLVGLYGESRARVQCGEGRRVKQSV
jgi:succinate dehydrogenase (ubiquinone) membrane anchor subunit